MSIDDVIRYIEPTRESGRALLQREIPGEVVMLNLMRFRAVADYAAAPDLAPPKVERQIREATHDFGNKDFRATAQLTDTLAMGISCRPCQLPAVVH